MPASYPKAKAECMKPKKEMENKKKILEFVFLDISLVKKFKMNFQRETNNRLEILYLQKKKKTCI